MIFAMFAGKSHNFIFQGNKVSSRASAFPGIINAQSPDVKIVLEDVVFRNNDYRSTVKVSWCFSCLFNTSAHKYLCFWIKPIPF